MRLEPYAEKTGNRVWLNEQEQQQLLDYYSEDPIKQLSIQLGLHGLRSEEITRVAKNHLRELYTGTDSQRYVLIIEESKTGYRECPVDNDCVNQIQMIANLKDLNQDEPIINVTTRTLQNWINDAVSDIADSTGTSEWDDVGFHDLRRTWATSSYWSLSGSRAIEAVQSWGGWKSRDVFVNNYLGKSPDGITAKMAQDAGIYSE